MGFYWFLRFHALDIFEANNMKNSSKNLPKSTQNLLQIDSKTVSKMTLQKDLSKNAKIIENDSPKGTPKWLKNFKKGNS